MQIESKWEALGLALPGPPRIAPHVKISFAWVWGWGNRAYVAGQGPQDRDDKAPEAALRVPRPYCAQMARVNTSVSLRAGPGRWRNAAAIRSRRKACAPAAELGYSRY